MLIFNIITQINGVTIETSYKLIKFKCNNLIGFT